MRARRRCIRCSRTFVRTSRFLALAGVLVDAFPSCGCRAAKARPGRSPRFAAAVGRVRPTAFRCSVSWPVAELTSLAALSTFKQAATSQSTKRAARAGHEPSAPQRRRGPLRPARTRLCRNRCIPSEEDQRRFCSRWAVAGRGDFWSGEERRARVGARSALRRLTRRGCLNEMSVANGVSSAARPWTEHRSGVGAKRRPLQHEPLAATARREPRQHAQSRILKRPHRPVWG